MVDAVRNPADLGVAESFGSLRRTDHAVVYTLVCDNPINPGFGWTGPCEHAEQIEGASSASAARRIAAKLGWRRERGLDWCPLCSREEEADTEEDLLEDEAMALS